MTTHLIYEVPYVQYVWQAEYVHQFYTLARINVYDLLCILTVSLQLIIYTKMKTAFLWLFYSWALGVEGTYIVTSLAESLSRPRISTTKRHKQAYKQASKQTNKRISTFHDLLESSQWVSNLSQIGWWEKLCDSRRGCATEIRFGSPAAVGAGAPAGCGLIFQGWQTRPERGEKEKSLETAGQLLGQRWQGLQETQRFTSEHRQPAMDDQLVIAHGFVGLCMVAYGYV